MVASPDPNAMPVNRRRFLSSVGLAAMAPSIARSQQGVALENKTPRWNPASFALQPFPMSQVRLLDGPFQQSQSLNQQFVNSIPVDRLLHNFRVNAGLPSSATPLGGWEKPDCELRGHFAGHYLSGCALLFASTGDAAFRTRAADLVAGLAACQSALGNGYLSAFPLEFFARLDARKKVWAPFYTIHKIMAGLLDVSRLCGNRQALQVVEGMAGWTDRWSQPLGEAHMQEILETEFGGMSETLYNLAAVTGNTHYAAVAVRFEKKRFLDPLANRTDVLKGLHVNTHVPQVIGAARGYELTQDPRYRDIADYFWTEVTTQRCYCTGGTSNDERWLAGPGQLAEELPLSTNTEECCVAYNMLKLTRRLFQWSGDPRYFDYYERVLFNHRLGTLDPSTGSGMYYLPLHTGSWKVFGSSYDSFWCCTGTGVEEHAKFNDSIYYRDREGIFVNLFIASEVRDPERGLRIRQETAFPDDAGTRLIIRAAAPARFKLRVRVPGWVAGAAVCRLNGELIHAPAKPGTYVEIDREWREGDRVDIDLPMSLRAAPLPGDARMFAVMRGPIVLGARMGSQGLTPAATTNGYEPGLHQDAKDFAAVALHPAALQRDLQPVPGQPLTYQAANLTFTPLNRIFGERYGVYWRAPSDS